MKPIDKDIDPDRPIDLLDVDSTVGDLLRMCWLALEHRKPRARLYDDGLRTVVALLLRSYWATHQSMRLIASVKDSHPELMADVCSLQREQVEKIFEILLLKDDPKRWVIRYFRKDWKASYEEFLHSRDEKRDLDRFKPFLATVGPNLMDKLRSLPTHSGKKRFPVVSAKAKRAVEVRYSLRRNPSKRPPTWYSAKWLDTYFEWPLPGRFNERLRDLAERARFSRWYLEYVMACTYSHVGARKLLIIALSRDKSMTGGQRVDVAATKAVEEALFVSYLACVSAVSEAVVLLDEPKAVRISARSTWTELIDKSLLARALWDVYEPLLS